MESDLDKGAKGSHECPSWSPTHRFALQLRFALPLDPDRQIQRISLNTL
jgi:hypothetical protein